jgi:transposase-like protein
MPRILKLTPALIEKIVGYLRAGAYVETAAAAAGISKQTLYNWLRRAVDENERDPIFAKFAAAVEEAQALAEVRDIALIGKAAETQWQAAAWRLERKSPERWGRKVELSGGLNLNVDTASLAQRIAALSAAGVEAALSDAAPAGAQAALASGAAGDRSGDGAGGASAA